ncbi:MAG: hypothetical protein J1F63_06030 [Oscillospiraceae bacterium]|nr:hypothetical protein [Oscillospiraceae bacterium]
MKTILQVSLNTGAIFGMSILAAGLFAIYGEKTMLINLLILAGIPVISAASIVSGVLIGKSPGRAILSASIIFVIAAVVWGFIATEYSAYIWR